MEIQEDILVDISPEREKYFGCSGKMLMPGPKSVEAVLNQIPPDRLVTMQLLGKELAAKHGAQVTCPVAQRNALKIIANDAENQIPYWRVVKKNGELIPYFPGGIEGHAGRLSAENHKIDSSGKAGRVSNFRERIYNFD